MKTPKPGQYVSINNVVYRARKRKNGCERCILNDILLCPMIVDSRFEHGPEIDCNRYDIILTLDNQ